MHASNPIPPSQNPTYSFASFNCDGPATIASTSLFDTVDILCHEFFFSFFILFVSLFIFSLLRKRPSVLAIKVRVLSCLCDTLPMRVREGGGWLVEAAGATGAMGMDHSDLRADFGRQTSWIFSLEHC